MPTPRKPKDQHLKRGPKPIPFKEEYIGLLIKHGMDGNPFETFGPTIGVSTAKLYDWCNELPEMQEAKKLSRDFALKWWFEKGKDNLIMPEGEKFNASVYIFTMKAMFQLRDGSESKAQLENPVGKTLEQNEALKKEIDSLKEALEIRSLKIVS